MLFLLLKMSQNTIDNVLVLNTRNDFQRPATPATDLYVNIENPLQALRPGHSSMALGRCPYFRICARLRCLATFGRGDLPAPAMVGG